MTWAGSTRCYGRQGGCLEGTTTGSNMSERARERAEEQGRVSATTLVLALLCAAVVVWGVNSRSGDSADDWDEQPDLSNLVASSTKTTLKGAPRDPAPRAATDGAIVRPKQATGVYDAPRGSVFG